MAVLRKYNIPVRTLWERRMLPDNGKIKEIGDYFPVVVRGNIAHDTVPHGHVEKKLEHSGVRSWRERLCQWLDW